MQNNPTDAQLKAVSDKFLHEIKTLQAYNKWIEVDTKPILLHKMQRQERVVNKAQLVIHLPFEVVAKYFDDPKVMKKISGQMIISSEVVYQTGSLCVVHNKMKAPGPMSDREIVFVYTYHKEGNKVYAGNRSVDYPVKADKDSVRAFAHVGGYILQKIDQKSTKLLNIIDVDIGGSVPDFLKNAMSSKRAATLESLQERIKSSLK